MDEGDGGGGGQLVREFVKKLQQHVPKEKKENKMHKSNFPNKANNFARLVSLILDTGECFLCVLLLK